MAVVSIDYIEIRDGKPRIAGTRIRVHDIANTHVHANKSIEWIVDNFEVTPAQIYAALSYYYDHKDQIDREIREDDKHIRDHAVPLEETRSHMRARLNEHQNTPNHED